MKRRLPNTTNKFSSINKFSSLKSFFANFARLGDGAVAVLVGILILVLWQAVSMSGRIPQFMLPSPLAVGHVFIEDFALLLEHAKTTLAEAFLGLLFGVVTGFVAAMLMDFFAIVRKGLFPLIIVTQTIPTIAIAPLLVLWLGYEMAPKIVLIVLTTFFPITVGLKNGFSQIDMDELYLLKAMGASRRQIFLCLKLPGALTHFFSGLRISAAYSVVGAVIAEWLGGYQGLGVYMVRVKTSFAFDKMFAVILLISIISIVLMSLVERLHRLAMPWETTKSKEQLH